MPRKIVCSLFGLLALAVLLGSLAPPAHDQTRPQKPGGDVFSGNGGGKPPPRTPRGEAAYCGCPAADSQEGRRQSEKQRYDPILFKLDSWDAGETDHYRAQLSNISRTTGRERQMALADIKLDHQREVESLSRLRRREEQCHKCRLDWISECCQGRVTIYCQQACFGQDDDGDKDRKDIKRVPRSESQDDSKASPRALLVAMNDCLGPRVVYYKPPVSALLESTAAQRPSKMWINGSPHILYNPSSLAAQSPHVRAMMLARPLAEYVLQFRLEKFGIDYINQVRESYLAPNQPLRKRYDAFGKDMDELLEIDTLVGFLVRCVQLRRLVPEEDLRQSYQKPLYQRTFESYDPGEDDSFWRAREDGLFRGYTDRQLPAYIGFDVPNLPPKRP